MAETKRDCATSSCSIRQRPSAFGQDHVAAKKSGLRGKPICVAGRVGFDNVDIQQAGRRQKCGGFLAWFKGGTPPGFWTTTASGLLQVIEMKRDAKDTPVDQGVDHVDHPWPSPKQSVWRPLHSGEATATSAVRIVVVADIPLTPHCTPRYRAVPLAEYRRCQNRPAPQHK
jgi:hypothetical protein